MKLTSKIINLQEYPLPIRKYLDGAKIFDSSCSTQAEVLFSDKDEGYFIKSAQKNTLSAENVMTNYFHSIGLAPKVLEYVSLDKDWLVTNKLKGNDCIYRAYLQNPEKLCDTLAETLLKLHSLDYADCPIKNHTALYLQTAEKNYSSGICDNRLMKELGCSDTKKVWDEILSKSHILQCNTLLHGDYCLPNVILDDWKLSGFIDLGNGGVGDRHVDIFWAIYTLHYNLHTSKYTKRFIDAYGKDSVDNEVLQLIAKIEIFG